MKPGKKKRKQLLRLFKEAVTKVKDLVVAGLEISKAVRQIHNIPKYHQLNWRGIENTAEFMIKWEKLLAKVPKKS